MQAYYLQSAFAVERAPTKALGKQYKRRKDVEVALLAEYPVKGLVFEAGESLTAMANLVGSACRRLQVSLPSSTPLPTHLNMSKKGEEYADQPHTSTNGLWLAHHMSVAYLFPFL